MKIPSPASLATLVSCLLLVFPVQAVEPNEVFAVWPDKPPGLGRERGPEKLVEGRPRPFYQITDVSKPTVSVYLPPQAQRTGAAVLVCPGGGLQRLAIEHEGIEVAQWLTSLNVSVFVLKYRVPEAANIALQDAQRALSLIRARASEWGVDGNDVGVIGFSAGAELAAWLETHHPERQYEPVDASDKFSCRPAYATLIYPGGLLQGGAFQLKEAIASRINRDTPPTFIAQAFDDGSENSLAMMTALRKARVPAEIHIYQEGSHGFGIRASGSPANAWKESWLAWLRSQGFLDSAPVRQFARELTEAKKAKRPTPSLAKRFPDAKPGEAFAIQRRVTRAALREDKIAGFRGVGLGATDLQRLGMSEPISGVLFRSDLLKSADHLVLDRGALGDFSLIPALGFLISVDISFEILNETQARGAIASVTPVVQVVRSSGSNPGGGSIWDLVPANLGPAQHIVGSARPLAGLDIQGVKLGLGRDGKDVPGTGAAAVPPGHWDILRRLLNQITGQGYTLHAGDLILCGSTGPQITAPGVAGKYQADFGPLGGIEFEVK